MVTDGGSIDSVGAEARWCMGDGGGTGVMVGDCTPATLTGRLPTTPTWLELELEHGLWVAFGLRQNIIYSFKVAHIIGINIYKTLNNNPTRQYDSNSKLALK